MTTTTTTRETISINGQRLQWCCDDFGISPGALAARLSIKAERVQQALRGERALTIPQLQKIGVFFKQDDTFFIGEGDIKTENMYSPQFRTINNQNPNITPDIKIAIRNFEDSRDTFMCMRKYSGDMDGIPNTKWQKFRVKTPAISNAAIDELVCRVRQWFAFGKGKATFTDYRRAIEAQGILVFVTDWRKGDLHINKNSPILGFSLYYAEYPVIIIKKRSQQSQVFTLMHELAHLLLHRDSFADDEGNFISHNKREREANRFAGQLLISGDDLSSIDWENFPRRRAAEYKSFLKPLTAKLGISTEVVLRRAMDSKLIAEECYQQYRRWSNADSTRPIAKVAAPRKQSDADMVECAATAPGITPLEKYDWQKPVKIFGKEYVGVILDSWHSKEITIVKASKFLGKLRGDAIRKLSDEYANL